MSKIILIFTMALAAAALCLGACSGSNGNDPEPGAIRKMTDQVADELVDKIKDPIVKAREVKAQEQSRLDDGAKRAAESSRAD